MVAARYWKVAGMGVRGNAGLRLSAFELGDSAGRVDATATLFSPATPTAGALVNLQDNNAATECAFAAADVRSGGFGIVWDLGSGVTKDVKKLWLGAVTAAQIPVRMDVFSSADGVNWTRAFRIRNIPFAGAGVKQLVDTGNYNAVVLDSAPLAFWPLDETSGTVAQELVAGRNGTRVGGAIVSGMGDFPAAFDPGGTGYISIPSNAAYDLDSLTCEFWLQTAETNNVVVLERNQNAGLSVQTTGTVANANFVDYGLGGVSGPGVQTVGSSRAVNDNIAHHVVMRMTSAGSRVFFDGEDVTRGSGNFGPSWAGAPWYIGSRGGVAGLSAGSKIAKVALYDRLLTDAEVKAHAVPGDYSAGPLVLATDGMVVYRDGPGSVTGEARLFRPSDVHVDLEDGGRGRVSGTVKVQSLPNAVPVHRRVRLIEERSGRVVREQWSDPVTGAYEFLWVREGVRYTVLASDHEHNFRAVVADNLLPAIL